MATISQGTSGGGFSLKPNPDADPAPPLHSWPGQSTVQEYNLYILAAAETVGIDPDLIRSVIYVETTQGWYDSLIAWADLNKSILPMNINTAVWRDFFGTREELKDPKRNIVAGAKLLKAISRNFDHDPSVAEIATLYNSLRVTKVTNYGARVEHVYRNKLWDGGGRR